MKKLLAILMICCTMLTLLPVTAFATSEDEVLYTTGCDDPTDRNDAPVEEVIGATAATEATKELPSAFTLRGTRDFPVIGNQGAIGCCTAMSTTYMQFTHAVSKLYHKFYPQYTWNPSSGARQYIFSPKYIYDYSGSSQIYSYNALMTMGATTLNKIGYAEDSGGGYFFEGNQKSTAWGVNEVMLSAMQYRLNDYLYKSFQTYDSLESRNTLIQQIKESLCAGNVVTVTGNSGYWQFTKLTQSGTIGKAGDYAMYSSMYYSGMSAGGHAVSIVGYDDDVECIVDGRTMKGAVLMANSWGQWNDAGFSWVMYDALAGKSEVGFASNPEAAMYITFNPNETDVCMYPPYLTTLNQNYQFSRVASKIISYHNYYQDGTLKTDSAKYFVYTIQDPESGMYLAYSNNLSDGVYLTPTKSTNCYWAFIPYSKIDENGKETGLCAWDGYNKDNYDSSYVGSYWVYAINRDTDNLTGSRFLDAGLGYASSGRKVGMASMNGGAYPEAKSWFFSDDVNTSDSKFTTKLGIHKGHDKIFTRTVPFSSYYFTEWDKNYEIGYDEIYLEVTVTVDNRNAFFVKPARYNPTTERWDEITNAMYDYRSSHLKFDVNLPNFLTYSGVVNGAPETVTLYLSYADLANVDDIYAYDWGCTFGVTSGATAVVTSARLLSGATSTELAVILSEPLTLTSTADRSTVYYMAWSDRVYASGDQMAKLVKHEVSADLPEGLQLSTLCSSSVTDGDSFMFDILSEDGSSIATDELRAVYVNGSQISRKNGVYQLSEISENQVITVDYTPKTYYTVTATVAPEFTLVTTSKDQIAEGEYYYFSLVANGDYSLEDVEVTANGEILLPNGGNYAVKITADTEIAVTYHSPVIPGDLTGDGIISIQDVTALLILIANGDSSVAGDLTGDGVISIQDVTALLVLVAG